jgi:hypothetical protein
MRDDRRSEGDFMSTHQPDWKIDHTVIDVMVKDRKTGKVLSRPRLKIKIDSWTRQVMSFRLEDPDDTETSEESSDK